MIDLYDKLIERAEEVASQIASKPPIAVRMMKEFVTRFRETPVTEAWRVLTLMNALLTQMSTDGDEGRAAFLEKREPHFTGGISCLLYTSPRPRAATLTRMPSSA